LVVSSGTFEDIVVDGAAQAEGAAVAMVFGESANVWKPMLGTVGSAKRTLYLAIRHAGYPIDAVLEADCIAGYLRHYSVLYVVEPQVSEKATAAIGEWVKAGGRAFFGAAAASLNEYNLTSTAAGILFAPVSAVQPVWVGSRACPHGIQDHRCEASRVALAKQDLAFAERLDRVYYPNASSLADGGYCGVFGEKAMLHIDEPIRAGAPVPVAAFGDGSPALLQLARGRGSVWLAAFHPGLSYFHPALPNDRPTDKGTLDTSYNHWIPTAFSPTAAALITAPLVDVHDGQPALASNPLVEVGVIRASALGLVLPCINWCGQPVIDLVVTLSFDLPAVGHAINVTLGSGGHVVAGHTKSGHATFKFDLEVAADAIVVRWGIKSG
jgi:hypothetical protein